MSTFPRHSMVFRFVMLSAVVLCAGSEGLAGYFGSFYPKGTWVGTRAVGNDGFGNNLYNNSTGDSWNFPAADSAYAKLTHSTYDWIQFHLVTNRNIVAALTTKATLPAFMNGQQYSYWVKGDIYFGESSRGHGVTTKSKFMTPGTVVGAGLRASQWDGHDIGDAETSYEFHVRYNHGFQPGMNVTRYNGAYSEYAWLRAGTLGPFRCNLPPLNSGDGRSRRVSLGDFSVPAGDAARNSYIRYLLVQNASLSASTASEVFIIPYNQLTRFLNGEAFTSYYALGSGWNNSELRLPPGRRYAVVVRDGVNTTSSEGAQAAVLITYYN